MAKEELQRLKKAFFTKKEDIQPQDTKPRLSPGLLVAVSFSLVLTASLVSFMTKDKSAPQINEKAGLAKKSTPKEKIPSPTIHRSIASNAELPEEIESLFLIQEMNRLKPLLKELPITINGSSATLVVNLRRPLNIYDKSLRLYFEDALQHLDIILKDYLYFSNSKNPVTLDLNNATVLNIGAADFEVAKNDLNLYKITQLRIVFDLTTLPFDFKIKGIEIAKK